MSKQMEGWTLWMASSASPPCYLTWTGSSPEISNDSALRHVLQTLCLETLPFCCLLENVYNSCFQYDDAEGYRGDMGSYNYMTFNLRALPVHAGVGDTEPAKWAGQGRLV